MTFGGPGLPKFKVPGPKQTLFGLDGDLDGNDENHNDEVPKDSEDPKTENNIDNKKSEDVNDDVDSPGWKAESWPEEFVPNESPHLRIAENAEGTNENSDIQNESLRDPLAMPDNLKHWTPKAPPKHVIHHPVSPGGNLAGESEGFPHFYPTNYNRTWGESPNHITRRTRKTDPKKKSGGCFPCFGKRQKEGEHRDNINSNSDSNDSNDSNFNDIFNVF